MFQHQSKQEEKKQVSKLCGLFKGKKKSQVMEKDVVIFSSKVHKVVSRNMESIYYFELSDQPVIKIIISCLASSHYTH